MRQRVSTTSATVADVATGQKALKSLKLQMIPHVHIA
jgi:hypothetical protein